MEVNRRCEDHVVMETSGSSSAGGGKAQVLETRKEGRCGEVK
jgi:hypothetical protein